jgi:uncharacterized protein (TIGR03790 family)
VITRVILTILLLLTSALAPGSVALALEAGEVLMVVNAADRAGTELASHYMQQRGISGENIVQVWLPDDETISRKQYDEKIAAPVRKALEALAPRRRIRCLLLMYGMPLRVAAPEIGPDEKRQIETLQKQRDETQRRIDALPAAAKDEKERLAQSLAAVEADIARAQKADHSASVDSEIALVEVDRYPLAGWVPNPFFLGNQNKELPIGKSRVPSRGGRALSPTTSPAASARR